MNEIQFSTGLVSYSLNGQCQVSFNPTDSAFVERLFATFGALDMMQEEHKAELQRTSDRAEIFEIARARDKKMRELIDGVFGAPVCEALFGEMNVYALAEGLPVWCNLMLAVMDEIDTGFETPLPSFSDYGMAALDEQGICCLVLDPVFAETVDKDFLPTVFLTKYGEGDIWVEAFDHDTVRVHGTPGLRFAWETRYAQANASTERLRVMGCDQIDRGGDYAGEADAYIDSAEIDYARSAFEYMTEFERSMEAA